MSKVQSVSTEAAPKAIGPYSQAVIANGFIFVSGQLGIDHQTNSFINDSVSDQAIQALNNLKVVLEAAGSSLNSVVKTTIYLADMDDFAVVNEAYANFFKEPYPARACIQAAQLPKNGKIEIEAVAVI